MRVEILPVALFLGSVSAQQATAAPWGQCGGSTVNNIASYCPAGQTCTVMNEFYSQCLPIAATSSTAVAPSSTSKSSSKSSTKTSTTLKTSTKKSTTTTKTTTSSTTTTKTAATPTITWVGEYAQCGGANNQFANVRCLAPFTCVYENEFFSNCFDLTGSSSSTTPSSTPAPTSTTSTSTTSAAATVSLVPLYGQCGGQTYSGPTVCAPPGICIYESAFFSNCFPPSVTTTTAA